MEIVGESIDEVLFDAYQGLRSGGAPNKGTRGDSIELLGVTLRIKYPRARLSRSADRGLPFTALGEFLWYLTGTDDVEFITSYIKAYRDEVGPTGAINGAYGPRIFSRYGVDQLEAVVDLLRRKPATRRAVVQIYSADDLITDQEVPCTTTLQFFIRDDRLHLAANLRSNDAYLGLPHDVFCFTMLQEMMARRLHVELGEYIQMVGSFHLYARHEAKVDRYLSEGHHRLAEMPHMPQGDPFPLIPRLLELEGRIRRGDAVDDALTGLHPYWRDLLHLLQVHFTLDDNARLDAISANLHEPTYRTYVEDRREQAVRKAARLAVLASVSQGANS